MVLGVRAAAGSLLPLSAKHAVRRALRRPADNARRYLPRGRSVDEFLFALTTANVRYAVLRWFEALPNVEVGGDIDMLVADEGLPAVEALLTPYRPQADAQKIDLYSAGGLPRTQFGGTAYFPRPLADRVLEGAVLLRGRYRVPSAEDHFDSLAFHAVHHKGAASRLPTDAGGRAPSPGDKIPEALDRLRSQLNQDVELTLHGLTCYLADRRLAPDKLAAARYAAMRDRLYGE
jgi:hypothetical protein